MTHRVPSSESAPTPTPRVLVHYAMPGNGKTHQTRLIYFRWPRCIAVDTQVVAGEGEYPGVVVGSSDELVQMIAGHDAAGFTEWRISYRPDGAYDPEDVERVFGVAAILPGTLLVVEEADKFTTSSYAPPGLFSIAHHGRRAGTGLVLNSRRPADVPRKLTSTAEVVRVWPLGEAGDLDHVRKLGFQEAWIERLEPYAFIERVRTVNERRFYHVTGAGVRTPLVAEVRGKDLTWKPASG